MISFIIIGYNEEKFLDMCFQSIYNAILCAQINKYEIIYVDSNSSDKSIAIACVYKEVKIFKIIGKCNAAIARNIGAKEAQGDIFFFIDGDMEINKDFIPSVIDENGNLIHDLISGQIIDKFHDSNFSRVWESPRFSIKLLYNPGNYQVLSSGVFIIKKDLWVSMNGMRTKFKSGEELDLGLRLARKGYFLFMNEKVITLHNTVPYYDRKRMWKMFTSGRLFYSRAMILRKHFFNTHTYPYFFYGDKTFIVLIASVFLSIVVPHWMIIFISVYFLSLIFRSLKQKKFLYSLNFFCYFLFSDITNLLFFFFFYPVDKKLEYICINNPA